MRRATSTSEKRLSVEKGHAHEEDDLTNLRRVVEKVPTSVWVAAFIGSAERFTFWGITAPFQNYIQNPLQGDHALPGALGLGQSTATTISNAFLLFSYVTPVLFAVLSDTKLGRLKTLLWSLIVYAIGCVILLLTALPQSLDHHAGLGGLIAAMVLIGLGVGGVKSTITPFIADQYPQAPPRVKVLKSGERVLTDRAATLQYVYNVFYWQNNIAGLSSIPTTWLERKVGFWAAYLLPTCCIFLSTGLLIVWRRKFKDLPPQGNVLPQTARVLSKACRSGFKLEAARPHNEAGEETPNVSWDNHFVDEIKRGLIACQVLSGFAVYYTCYNQISNNLISQAGQMDLHGVPNDMIQALNPVACVLLGPVIQGLFQWCRKHKLRFAPIARITVGFMFMAAAMAYAAGVQKLIYNTGPCYDMPLACAASNGGSISNHLNVWIQTPVYFLLAVSEIFAFVTVTEYTYSKAPTDLKALVQAIRQAIAGVGSGLGMAISPTAKDPHLVIMYSALAGVMVVATVLYYALFGKFDRIDERLDKLDEKEESSSPPSEGESSDEEKSVHKAGRGEEEEVKRKSGPPSQSS